MNEPNDHTDDLIQMILTRHQAHQQRLCNRLHKAVMLAPSIEVCEALLRNQPVPISRLDQKQARMFGL